MRIVWDEPKRQANLAKHGLDFAKLDAKFFMTAKVGAARDGRLIAIGPCGSESDVLAVVFALRGREAISIISMRPASARERKLT